MTKTQSLTYIIVAALILAVIYLYGASASRVGASAPPGNIAFMATTSMQAVNTTASLLFATSSCSARIVSTVASPVMLTFYDASSTSIGLNVPSGVFGHLQAASTTVVYDSGQYGCGTMRAFSFVASTITVSESR